MDGVLVCCPGNFPFHTLQRRRGKELVEGQSVSDCPQTPRVWTRAFLRRREETQQQHPGHK